MTSILDDLAIKFSVSPGAPTQGHLAEALWKGIDIRWSAIDR